MKDAGKTGDPKNPHLREMTPEEEVKFLREAIRTALAKLLEHCDTAHIFCTSTVKDTTVGVNDGAGNYYARHAQIEEWLLEHPLGGDDGDEDDTPRCPG